MVMADNQNIDDAPRRRVPSWLRETAILVVVALVLSVLLQTFVGRVYYIPSGSMEPTLLVGDRIAADKMTFRFGYRSTRSDNPIVKALQDAGSWAGLVAPDENDLVKRVIATGGQTVQCCDAQGRVEVDGRPLDEPYVVRDFPFVDNQLTCRTAPPSGRCFGPVEVPDGSLWVMGDNRSGSADSRAHAGDELGGTVPVDDVIGKARLIVLPPSRWGVIDSPSIQQR